MTQSVLGVGRVRELVRGNGERQVHARIMAKLGSCWREPIHGNPVSLALACRCAHPPCFWTAAAGCGSGSSSRCCVGQTRPQ